MALFGQRRNRRRLRAWQAGLRAPALIRASEPVGEPGSRNNSGDTIFDLELNVFGTRAYWFTLEVRIPDGEPYEMSGRFDVPRRAENVSFFNIGNALKPGLELPVRVDAHDSGEVGVDWDRFLSTPGRRQAVRAASDGGKRERVREQIERNPKLQAKLRANNRMALDAWVGAVRTGQMSREEFEQTVTLELETGRMEPADAQAARSALS